MKGILFKVIFVFIFTVIISISIGVVMTVWAQSPDFTFTVNGVVQTEYNPILLGINTGIIFLIVITCMLGWFYITNIAILITTYKGTKEIEDENVIYQRDLSEDYNSAIASYIIDGTVETKQDYQAVIVELENKNLIYKENGKYKVREENYKLTQDLLNNQKVVWNQIRERKINLKQFKNAVIQDAKELGYMDLNTKLIKALFIMGIINPASIFIIFYMIFGARPYMNILTEKGKIEKDKILKLKRYLTNYSNLHQLDKSDNNIWGEYLAYAISLQVNKKIKVKQIEF